MGKRGAQCYLRELIQTGALSAGDIVRPGELAERLGLDVDDMKAAAANLEAFGVLERVDARSFAVRILDAEELADFMRMRMEIEVRVARTLALTASDTEIRSLRGEVNSQRNAALSDQRVLFMEASARFHRMLAEAANFLHGARILRTWEDYQQIVGMRALEKPDAMLNAVHEHEELLDRIESHDSIAAEEAMRSHLQRTLDRLDVSVDA